MTVLRALAARRHAWVCAGLALLAFLQAPGRIVADTKIDLALNPVQFLGRSLHLWDPSGAFGQVQNQAYGYLWPMGPFFLLGTEVGLPAWVVQRLWWTLLLCVAYLGVVRLAQRLGIGTPTSRLVAGLVFALSPRILTEIGPVSVEAWPTAVAPWVLIPLVGLARGGSVRRAVTLSALAVACAGGVNGTAVLAVVPLAGLWLLTLQPLRRRIVALVAWGAAVLAATLWWIWPLVLLGRYSPPFFDFVETAATTTWPTDPISVLRGANHWGGWLEGTYGAERPAGWQVAINPVAALAGLLLAAVGLAGLARRGMPHRRFLVTGLVAGFAILGLGHIGQLPFTFAEAENAFLDGAGAPLRNLHKFDVVLRLPLALGVAHLLAVLPRVRWPVVGRTALRQPGLRRATLLTGALAAIAGLVVPAWSVGLAAPRSFTAVPGYWHEAANWLNDRADEGRVLVLPGARFPHYTWGDTLDEVTQPLLSGPVAVRSIIPMAPPSTIRMMDTVEAVLASGAGSPGLADYLARAGISYVLVRNDLEYGLTLSTAPVLVQQALSRSPGLSLVTTFGPDIPPTPRAGTVDELAVTVPALQVLRVDRPVRSVTAWPADQVPTVVGGPESVLALAEAGLLPPGPVVLAGDRPAGPVAGGLLLTDDLRLRDRSYGLGRDAGSTTLTAQEGAGAHDLVPAWAADWSTTASYPGVAGIGASSSWSDKNSSGDSRPEHQPFAAFDGDPATSWRPTLGVASVGQWIEVRLADPRPVPEVTIDFAQGAGGRPTRVTVDTGAARTTVETPGWRVTVPLDATRPADHVRVTIDGFEQTEEEGVFGITGIAVPGVTVERTLLMPTVTSGTPATVLLSAAPEVPACAVGPMIDGTALGGGLRCADWIVRASEDGGAIDRTLTLPVQATYAATLWARPRTGAALDALLDGLLSAGVTVTASSSAFSEPAARPGALVDGDAGTTWWADAGDRAPTLRFTWAEPQRISGVRLSLAGAVAATAVVGVTVSTGQGEQFTGELAHGELRFAPVTTTELTLRLEPDDAVIAHQPYLNKVHAVPVGLTEVEVLGAAAPARSPRSVDLPCGSGPTLRVGDQAVATRLTATVADLLARREVPATACGQSTVDLAGTERVITTASDLATPTRVVLLPTAATAASTSATAPAAIQVDRWTANERLVTVAPHGTDLVLVVSENTNPGWTARLGDMTLTPTVVDGWQQAWIVPAGLAGQVVLSFQADATYRTALAVGAALVLIVLVVALIPARAARAAAPAHRDGIALPLVAGAVAFVVVAGALGALVAATGITIVAVRTARPYARVGARWLRQGWRAAAWLVPPALLGLGAAAWVVVWEPHKDWIPQLLGVLAVAGVWLLALATGAPPRRPTVPRR